MLGVRGTDREELAGSRMSVVRNWGHGRVTCPRSCNLFRMVNTKLKSAETMVGSATLSIGLIFISKMKVLHAKAPTSTWRYGSPISVIHFCIPSTVASHKSPFLS